MKHPPYHLRANKAIDRILFLQAINCIGNTFDLAEHVYIGFGGPFLEDMRLINDSRPNQKCISIEKNRATHKRQKFHRNTKLLKFVNSDFDSYLTHEFNSGTPCIIWLDYTDLSPANLEEFARVIQLVGHPSIVRVTVHAQFDLSLLKAAEHILNEDFAQVVKKGQLDEFNARYGDYLGSELTEEDTQVSCFADVVQGMFHYTSERTLPSASGMRFQIVHSCRYSDGPQMLSITGIVGDEDQVANIQRAYDNWPHSNLIWTSPHHIDVPDLSLKERLHLEKHLPAPHGTGKQLQRALGYSIDKGASVSERKLHQYQQFYQYYPIFAKMSL